MLRLMNCHRKIQSQLKQTFHIVTAVRYMSKTHYEVLGISKTASPEEVKAAFVSLSKQLHPDRNPGNHEKFVKLNEAYSILSKSGSRQDYDMTLAGFQTSGHSSHPAWESQQQRNQRMYSMHMEHERRGYQNQKNNTRRTVAIILAILILVPTFVISSEIKRSRMEYDFRKDPRFFRQDGSRVKKSVYDTEPE